eukprot:m.16337 g.16337  ORF g.16337 m.16337 type:complete len:399 (-) comp10954_c0_seq2:2165-3361(-)
MALPEYCQSFSHLVEMQDGLSVAHMLDSRSASMPAVRIASSLRHGEDPFLTCQRFIDKPFDEVVAERLKAIRCELSKDSGGAYTHQEKSLKAFRQVLEKTKEQIWILKPLARLAHDLRVLAFLADENAAKSEHTEGAMKQIRDCFTNCSQDRTQDLTVSKKLGLLSLMNELCSIAFKLNNFAIMPALTRTMEQNTHLMDKFCKSHRVTYSFYSGRRAMFEAKYSRANKELTFALEKCHRESVRNKRMILIYLTPVKLLIGQLPSKSLLERYGLHQFIQITDAVRHGNLLVLRRELQQHQPFFVHWGIYMILEKLRFIAYRNLFKRVQAILGTTQIKIEAFKIALVFMQESDVDIDEIECIVANLIHQKYIKGYISHGQRKLVVSKKEPFPNLATFLGA